MSASNSEPRAKKTALVLSTLYPNATNRRFGTFVARSIEALAARPGWDVHLINPIGVPPIAFGKYRALKEAAQSGMENGVMVHRPTFPLIPKYGGRYNPRLIAHAVLPLVRRLHAEIGIDVVDAQFFYPDGPAVARIAKALKLPYSIKARGADIHYWGSQRWTSEQMLDAAEGASGLLAVCGALADDMAAQGFARDKIHLHYTGLDRELFRPMTRNEADQKIVATLGVPWPDGAKLLVSTGALIPRKGQEFAIGALLDIPNAHLALIGKGEDEPNLRAHAQSIGVEDRVHFLGLMDHDMLSALLSRADAMVLPSASEGLANAWVEALACGTPLVITDAGGAREVVTGPDAGVIVARNSQAVAAGIREVLRRRASPEAVAKMAERFSWEENGAALARYYDQLISS